MTDIVKIKQAVESGEISVKIINAFSFKDGKHRDVIKVYLEDATTGEVVRIAEKEKEE